MEVYVFFLGGGDRGLGDWSLLSFELSREEGGDLVSLIVGVEWKIFWGEGEFESFF